MFLQKVKVGSSSQNVVFVAGRCAVEPTLTFYPINNTLMAFRFQSFRFLADYPSVYLHCRAYSCANTDNSVTCDQNCRASSPQSSSARRRRDLPEHAVQYEVDSGPIVVIDSDELARLLSKSNGKLDFSATYCVFGRRSSTGKGRCTCYSAAYMSQTRDHKRFTRATLC